MIHSKSNDGFTLIEVLLALSLMAMILTPILISQSSIMFQIGMFRERFRRVSIAKNYLAHAHKNALEDKKTVPLTVDDPPTTLTYRQDKASGTITKIFKDVYRETVRIEWTEGTNKRQDVLVSFVFEPEKKTEQKT